MERETPESSLRLATINIGAIVSGKPRPKALI